MAAALSTPAFADISEGMTRQAEYIITPEIYEGFLSIFGDTNPLHVDADRAQSTGFAAPVMHGAIQNGFISHFVGMVFPGDRSLLLSVEIRYLKPCYLGDVLELKARVSQKSEPHQVILMHVVLENKTQGCTASNGRVQVKIPE